MSDSKSHITFSSSGTSAVLSFVFHRFTVLLFWCLWPGWFQPLHAYCFFEMPRLAWFFFRSGCSFSLLVDLLAAWLSACCLGAHLFKWLTDAVENLLAGTFAVQTVTYHLNLRHVAKGENPKPVSFWGCPIFTIFIFLSLGTRTGRWPLWLWGEPSWQAIQGMYATHHERDPTDSH